LVVGERRARLALARGVADGRREVADDEDGAVAEVLELPELPEHDGVAEVEVRPRGVDAELDRERAARLGRALQLLGEGVFGEDLRRPAADPAQLFFDGGKGGHVSEDVVLRYRSERRLSDRGGITQVEEG